MKERPTAGYYLLRGLTWIVQLFPLRFHYMVSDFFYLLVYHVIRYRRTVVYTNLRNSFPEKSPEEISAIARKFYHHFCDNFFETLYMDRISPKEVRKRLTVMNEELLEKYLDDGRIVIFTLAHYNNWEWFSYWPMFSKFTGYAIYKKLKNKSFDLFYKNMRSRFGTIPLERADTYRQMISDARQKRVTATGFIMDQTPRIHDIHYWTTFLNQETPVITGTEKVARKIDAVVLYGHLHQLRRGYNCIELELIAEHAARTEPFEITEKSTRLIEKRIIERPELWLWSHKRWKHKREQKESVETVFAGTDETVAVTD